jgi:hypothetical protein
MAFASTHEGITRDRAPQCPKKTRTIEKICPSGSLNAFEPREHFFALMPLTVRTSLAWRAQVNSSASPPPVACSSIESD